MATSNWYFADFHTHCLPDLDDGAENVTMATAMLKAAAEQGAQSVVATPHFYWGDHSVGAFLERRKQAYAALQPHLKGLPQVILGAEVLLREGISREDLRPLCLGNSSVLLVELPFIPAPGWLVEELENIAYTQDLTIMLAHLDRYMPWYSSERISALLDLPDVIVQLNADALVDKRYCKALNKWLPYMPRLVLGSDMHDDTHRAPLLDQAVARMEKKRFSQEWLDLIETTTRELLPQLR
ncbi:MAG: hypothetical protein E7527_06635 [Ruminococcaceae bacterium]|nr:hypothetical protein [Oscillospiraceae bacterium]